jgi:hypothetical protein
MLREGRTIEMAKHVSGAGSRRRWAIVAVLAALMALLPGGLGLAGAAEPTFTISVAPESQTLSPGGSAVFLIELTAVDGFASPVTLSVEGLPGGITRTFSPATVTPTGVSFLTLRANTSTALGSFSFTVTGTGGGVTKSSGGSANVDFALVPRCFVDVTGTVTDKVTGAPVAAASVTGGNKSATTDETGRFTLPQVGLGTNNAPISVAVTASKNPPATNRIGTYWSASSSTILVCDRAAQLDLSMVPVVPAKLGGRVLEGRLDASGNVVPVVPETALVGASAGIPLVGNATTDATGAYTFKDSTGLVGIHLGQDNAPLTGEISISGPNLPARQRYWTATIQAGAIAPGDDLVAPTASLLRQCTASISGRITDDTTGEPVPAANVRIASLDTRTNDTVNVTTATDGTYNVPAILFGFNNAPSALRVTVSKTGFTSATVDSQTVGCGTAAAVPVAIRSNTSTSTVFFGTVTGRVVDKETGAAISGAVVRASGCTIQNPATDCLPATTAADGTYTIARVSTGTTAGATRTVAVTATAPTYRADGNSVSVVLASGATAGAPDIQLLKERFASVTGRVVDEVGPIPGAAVSINREASCAAAATSPLPCTSGADGTFDIFRVKLGNANANVNATVSATAAGYWSKSKTLPVQADQTADFGDLTLVKICTAAISGTVRNAVTQEPVPAATVSSGSQSAVTGADGKFRVTGIQLNADNAPRSVQITASALNFFPATLTVALTSANCKDDAVVNVGARPEVTSVSPSSGPTAGGTTVTIKGSNFTGATAVSFGTTASSSFTFVSDTELTAVAPAGVAGTVDVVVKVPGALDSAPSAASKFTYVAPAPVVSSVSPSSGSTAGGTSVTISGSNFTGATGVSFGGVAASSFSVVSGSQITAVSPARAAGQVDVVVRTPAGSSVVSSASRFTFVAPTPCDGQTPPVRVAAALTTVSGARVSVDLTKSALLPFLQATWSGNVDLRAPSPQGALDVRGPVLLAPNTVTATQGRCGSLSLSVPAVDVGRFPWRFSTLRVELVPGDGQSAPQVGATFADTAVPLGPAVGRLTVR